MGCDIHCYVEYRRPEWTQDFWNGFGGRINPGRNYEMFGRMADVRGSGPPVVEQRGIPEKLGWAARNDWYLFITEHPGDGYVTHETALRYASYGRKIVEQNGKPTWVEHPDWHTPSWLTIEEYEAALTRESGWPPQDEYWAVLAAMKCLRDRGNDVRLVFWFDN